MKYNEDMEWYEEIRNFRDEQVEYMIEDYSEDEAEKEIISIEKWLEKEIDKILKKAIAEKLLEMKNKYWLSSNEKEKTLEEMFENMKLKEVGITKNKVELYFSENGMFDNHRIVINLDKIGNKYNYFGVGI